MGTQWYLNTFWRLARSRNTGFGIGYIPLSEVINYGEKVGHIEDSLEDFIDIIQMMDDLYVSKASSKKASAKS